ncbi:MULTISPECIES: NADPH:quinone oxidoreductase family protein [Dermacoccus]|uniref:NADPH:quinone oxidoreductase family protein n=1 Tax=Dermacoccus TaxID=57495 RepID=UPI0001E63EDA|nr:MULTISPECIES: NADPH:quinone oxidoreductase family protein [Dermacoccus]EFP56943.1 GroES-like protein [Dermacoccus sp. Ellin185]MCG7428773.1 NADPH:quinone oxidoreductase family protein [Dermacoccus nishinomiyaensis]MCI0153963.1 NADPH:quinone oxidoreductase family protein [Dermacoccus nishinomiyaensis]HCQ18893.1 NADPH:quinone oxidoreductase family protein [Dermacoccus sp.]
MRAVQVVTLDGPGAVRINDVDAPTPKPHEVLIDVRAAGLCYPDALLTRGLYQMKPEPPFTLGAEVAGVVAQAPEGSGFSVGDRVVAFPGFGGMAEQVCVAAPFVFHLPDDVSFETGAALPMNYLTVQFALDRRGRLAEGETVLVHGAAGGIGIAAIQHAKARGARVIAVASSNDKRAIATQAGADDVIAPDGFKDAVMELTDGRGVDIVVDPVGGDRFTDSLRSLAVEGRLLVIGFTGGAIPEVKVNRLLLNNVDVVGVGWGAFWMPRPETVPSQWKAIEALVASGQLSPVLGEVRPLERAGEAIAEMEERRATGKLVLTL